MQENRIKYPRTFHLPWSLGATDDDKVLTAEQLSRFYGKQVVVTEKMDGENSTIYCDGCHARSLDSQNHPSRSWLKSFVASRLVGFPEAWRICGENLYARHSIPYDRLPSYFLAFSAWEGEKCFSWSETVDILSMLEITTVPVLFQGEFNAESVEVIKRLWTKTQPSAYGPQMEGYVVRLASAFNLCDFATSVAKFVRKDHVQTSQHWMQEAVIKNGLAEEACGKGFVNGDMDCSLHSCGNTKGHTGLCRCETCGTFFS